MRARISVPTFAAVVLVSLTAGRSGPAQTPYVQEIDAWHHARIERLKSPTGWLSLIGLHSLSTGENHLGSANDNDILLPDFAPPHVGRIEVGAQGSYRFVAAAGVKATVDGHEVGDLLLRHDQQDDVTLVSVGRLVFYVIERGGQPYLRVKDTESPLIASFEGIERWPVDPRWRIEARWESYDPPKQIPIADVLGNLNLETCPGAAVFDHQGRSYRLEPTGEAGEELFLVFGDRTNGDGSYGGGRFLTIAAPAEGKVILDFNRAYNPPCVFTPYATCPLPRPEDRLDFEVPAGEKNWGASHE